MLAFKKDEETLLKSNKCNNTVTNSLKNRKLSKKGANE